MHGTPGSARGYNNLSPENRAGHVDVVACSLTHASAVTPLKPVEFQACETGVREYQSPL